MPPKHQESSSSNDFSHMESIQQSLQHLANQFAASEQRHIEVEL